MNKRHYEHTLPNIRGSLSNTYVSSSVLSNDTALLFTFRDVQVSNQKLIRAKPEFRSPFIKNVQRFNRTAPATPFSVRTSS